MNFKHLYYFWKVATAGGVMRAGEELHITPQTISGQVQLLEANLGTELFARHGRNLELTENGRLALGYADEIFSLGAELEQVLRLDPESRQTHFRIGVADAVPKPLAYRLIEPATHVTEPVRIMCREWKLDSLLSELAVHRLDLVIADAPIPASVRVRAFSHRLGESGMSFMASPALARRCSGAFPKCLDAMPMLLPGEDAPVRHRLLRWLEQRKLRPRIVGEFDDSALMNAFGQSGAGVFVSPTVLDAEMQMQYGVETIGRTAEVRSEFFAISVERKLKHPCVLAITETARDRLFVAAG